MNFDKHGIAGVIRENIQNLCDAKLDDVKFHSIIWEKSNHTKLQKLIENFVLQTQLYMRMSKYNMLVDSNLPLEYGVHDRLI